MSRGKSRRRERPDPCLECGSPAWWNGTRQVAQIKQEGPATRRESEQLRRRARCSCSRACPAGSWTVYEPGGYPHRQFQLAVLASIVAAAALARTTLEAVAALHMCSRRSVVRWCTWIGGLAEPADLLRACARLDPDGHAHAGANLPRSLQVLSLLDRLADLFVVRGAPLPGWAPGIVRLLGDQLRRFGDVLFLTRSSPPLRVDLLGGAM